MEGFTNEEKAPAEEAVHAFISKYFSDEEFRRQMRQADSIEVDISDPHRQDTDSIREGNFEVSKLNVVDLPDGEKQFHCYVGNTEIHISGNAAKEVENMM